MGWEGWRNGSEKEEEEAKEEEEDDESGQRMEGLKGNHDLGKRGDAEESGQGGKMRLWIGIFIRKLEDAWTPALVRLFLPIAFSVARLPHVLFKEVETRRSGESASRSASGILVPGKIRTEPQAPQLLDVEDDNEFLPKACRLLENFATTKHGLQEKMLKLGRHGKSAYTYVYLSAAHDWICWNPSRLPPT
eukprot:757916-Hanusia_phi.AAC.4